MAGMIEFNGASGQVRGRLATPTSGSGPGVIVLQEWWGLVPHIQRVTERFAVEGFVALAPDLYGGKSTTEPAEAGSLMMALEVPAVERILAKAIDALLARPETTGAEVGVVGFCMGGQLSLYGACANPKVGACVNFYGIHPNFPVDAAALSAPVLGNFAERDTMTSPAVVADLAASLTAAGKPHDFKIYPGVDHAFFNDERPEVYDREAAEDAWRRTISFFREHLA